MFASSFRYLVRAAVGAVAATMLFATLSTNTVHAATVDEFLANPAQVMAQYPDGGAAFISLIRDVATSHPEALSSITALLSSGNADQQAGIGSGLGQAYKIVLHSDQAYAGQIATAVGASASTAAQTAYSGATGDVSTASTGGGIGAGGGAGGGSGGSVGGGPPSGGTFGSSGTTNGSGFSRTNSTTFTGGSGVSGTTSSGTANSVSPRR